MPEITTMSATETTALAPEILNFHYGKRVFAFRGGMGAGKTTLIKSLCAHLGVAGQTGSPTFAIVHEYHSKSNGLLYHFDFYRINSSSEAFDAGVHEYLNSGAFCFIEWPEHAKELLPPETIFIEIDSFGNSDTRTIRY